jgi:hypothetical protein
VVGEKLAKIFLMVRTTIKSVFFRQKKAKNGENFMVIRDIPRFFRG